MILRPSLAMSKLSEGICGFRLFWNQNQEKHRKNTRRFKVNSSSIRQFTVYLEIQSINWGNPAFFDPSFCCTFRSHRTIIGSRVSMSVKHKPLHLYGTLLLENPSFNCNSLLVNQKPVCYFKSKYPVNMTVMITVVMDISQNVVANSWWHSPLWRSLEQPKTNKHFIICCRSAVERKHGHMPFYAFLIFTSKYML